MKFLVSLVLLAACSTSWRRAAPMLVVDGMIACDDMQTAYLSDHGRWDYRTATNHPLLERNPVLGQRPPRAELGAGLVGAVAVNALVTYRAPTWLRWAWFLGVGAAETYAIKTNSAWAGACGVAGARHFTPQGRM